MDQNALVPLKEFLTNLVNWLKNTNINIDEFEIIDTSFEDWGEIITKSSKVLGFVVKAYNSFQQIIFRKFIKGLAMKINNKEALDYASKQNLDDYLSKKKNLEFVYNTIRKSLTANSLKCTELLAIIVGEILLKQIEMSPENIIIIDALHVLNDYDLDNFYKIYKYLSSKDDNKERLDILYKEIGDDIKLSISKLINTQLIIQEYAKLGINNSPVGTIYGNIRKDDEKYIITYSISKKLFDLLNQANGQILFLN